MQSAAGVGAFRTAPPVGWLRVADLAGLLGMPARTLRNRLKGLPDAARDKRNGTVVIDALPAEWRAKLAYARPKAEVDPTTMRFGDVRRDRQLNGILDRFEAFYRERLAGQPRLTEREAYASFCRTYGDGALFGRAIKPGWLRRKWALRCKGITTFKETRGRPRSNFDKTIGKLARARFLAQFLSVGTPLTTAYEITDGEARRHPGDPDWRCPSESRFRAWIKAEHPEYYTKVFREGWQKWRSDCQPKLTRNQHSQLCGNELWEVDGTTADYFVRLNNRKVRPTVINVVDVSSGLVVGWARGRSESQETVIQAFRRAVERYGCPMAVRTDLGEAFLGEAVGDRKGRRTGVDVIGLFDQLAIRLETCIGKSPWQKSNAESVFNAFAQRYCPLHGKAFIGHNHKDRVAGVDKWCDEHLDQLKTLEEDDELVGKFFEAENLRPRRQLGGLSPLQKFESDALPMRSVPDELLDFLFSRVQRTRVTTRGIPVRFGSTVLHFRSERTWELTGRRVTVRVNDANPGWLWVCDEKGQALFKVNRDDLQGCSAADIREAGKMKAKARKEVKRHYENVEIANRHSIDTALQLQREHAEAKAAANAGRLQRRERGRTVLVNPATAQLKTIRREELRTAVGAEGMTAGAGLTLEDLAGCYSVPDTEAAGMDLLQLTFDDGQGRPNDSDAFEHLMEGATDGRDEPDTDE